MVSKYYWKLVKTRPRLTFLCTCLVLHAYYVNATTPGARLAGIGYTSQASNDLWAFYFNPATATAVSVTGLAFGFENRYGFSGFNTMALAYNQPLRWPNQSNVAIGCQRFGDEWFNQTQASITAAHCIKGVSLGVQAVYFQTYIFETGTRANVLINMGGKAQITKHLSFGASVYNANQAQLTTYDNGTPNQRLPTIIRFGVFVQPYSRLTLATEVEKDVERPVRFKAGIEYGIIESFFVRTGFNIGPNTGMFGFGYKRFGFALDYAMQWHVQLGFVHVCSLGYVIQSFKNIEKKVDTP